MQRMSSDNLHPSAEEGEGRVEEEKEDEEAKYIRVRKTVWLLYFFGFLDLVGVSMVFAVIPNLALNLHASRSLTGLIGSMYGAIQVFSSPLMGRLSDAIGRKPLLLLCYLIPALGYVGMGYSPSLLLLALSRVPIGLFKNGLSIGKAYLIDLVPRSKQSGVLGLFNASGSVGFMIGPLIGGFLADWDPSLKLSFTACAATFFCIFILIFILLPDAPPSQKKSDWSSIREFFTFKGAFASLNMFSGVKWRNVADLLFLRLLLTFSAISFRINYPQFLQQRYGVSYKSLGGVMSFSGVVSTVTAALSGSVSKLYAGRTSLIVLHGTALLSVSLLVASITPYPWISVACLIPVSLATSNLKISMLNMLMDRAGASERGALIGVGESINSLSRMAAPGVIGVAQEHSTTTAGLVSAAMSFVVTGIVAVLHFRSG